jgi:flagellar motility protein MotE (MotC chaperone)
MPPVDGKSLLREVLQGDVPAPQTLKYIEKTDEFMAQSRENLAKLNGRMDKLEQKIDNVHESTKRIETIQTEMMKGLIKQQEDFMCFARDEHNKIYDRVNDVKSEMDGKKADGEDFKFWKWIIVVGIFLSIFSIFMSLVVDKYLNK